MVYKYLIVIQIALPLAIAVMITAGVEMAWILTALASELILSVWLWRSVMLPLNAARNGFYLIKEQDFGSRLRHKGNREADRIIDMFNRMMDTLKAERLKNLEQNRFLSQLIEASPMGVAICDLDRKIAESNNSFKAMATAKMLEALDNLEDDESLTLRIDPSHIYRIMALWFMDSGFRRRFYLVELLTEEIAAAEKNILHKMVRTIGHEVNNSLASVNSVLETIKEFSADDVAVVQTIDSCLSSTGNLVKFVKRYADLVKLPTPELSPVDLGDFITGLIPSLTPLAGNNVKIDVEIERHSIVRADTMLLERVVVNVVKNAVESIGECRDGHIRILVDGNKLYISDNGKGILPENMQKLFSPFFSTKNPDRGLGLMLISEILRSHNAAFTLSTDSSTALTTFSINFPR